VIGLPRQGRQAGRTVDTAAAFDRIFGAQQTGATPRKPRR
jgi:hypothetical protein